MVLTTPPLFLRPNEVLDSEAAFTTLTSSALVWKDESSPSPPRTEYSRAKPKRVCRAAQSVPSPGLPSLKNAKMATDMSSVSTGPVLARGHAGHLPPEPVPTAPLCPSPCQRDNSNFRTELAEGVECCKPKQIKGIRVEPESMPLVYTQLQPAKASVGKVFQYPVLDESKEQSSAGHVRPTWELYRPFLCLRPRPPAPRVSMWATPESKRLLQRHLTN